MSWQGQKKKGTIGGGGADLVLETLNGKRALTD